tara:strand:- start:1247 stop:1519 length:273 start_codon:yes stop_codon:yes gene_type:complete
MKYKDKLDAIEPLELESRIKLVSEVHTQLMASNSENIFKELLSENFTEVNAHSIIVSLNNINMLLKSKNFIEMGIINPDLAEKMDNFDKI